MQGVELEGECPAFRVFIISLKYVISGSIFPLIHWLFDSVGVEHPQKGTLARPDVSLHRND